MTRLVMAKLSLACRSATREGEFLQQRHAGKKLLNYAARIAAAPVAYQINLW